ncbi:binding-protein dependent transport system inner membrane protein [Oleiphilus messinensis]|uniref:Binding-protein dependent transport system inner membrane protein n=2 Tax=Oleiphilus messinensis TaxID=141451 RepID=A0A1Y0ICV7_9GAMM|nr:binding-protein dependent transport system inner membrane protein [Oleiphilus messinensis]
MPNRKTSDVVLSYQLEAPDASAVPVSSKTESALCDDPASEGQGHAVDVQSGLNHGTTRSHGARIISGAMLAHAGVWGIRLAALAVGVFVWHLLTLYNVNWYINFENIPGPVKVGETFWGHLQDEAFYVHIGVSMGRILQGYFAATVLGIVLGLIMGRSRLMNNIIMPYIEVFRPIPAVAWIPLAILMWPTEESSIIYITFLGALFPIILNTVHGVEQTPEVLVRAAQSLGAFRLQIFWHVVLPSALPSIAAGLAIGMGVSWFSLLAGEIISGQYGIGYFTWDAYSLINYPDIVVGMLVIGVLGTASTCAVRLVTRPLLAWQKRSR